MNTWSALDIVTLLAILTGPILAVLVTRYVDGRRERDSKRRDIFQTLMRTRRIPMSADHVGALNMIELEFADEATVLSEWRALLTHFGAVHSRRPEEVLADGLNADQQNARTAAFNARLYQERQALLARLLHAMAKVLRFKAEQLDIFQGG